MLPTSSTASGPTPASGPAPLLAPTLIPPTTPEAVGIPSVPAQEEPDPWPSTIETLAPAQMQSSLSRQLETPAPKGIFTVISSGDLHTCALRLDGSPVCWGDNRRGQATPPEGAKFRAISAGDYHTCALTMDGSPACWGTHPRRGEFNTPEEERFTSISSYSNRACGLREDGSVKCWGSEYFGPVASPKAQGFVSVTTGAQIGCGLRADNSVGCWALIESREQPATTAGKTYFSVSSGDNYSCAVREKGHLDCWQHYSAATSISGTPGGGDYVAVSVSDDYACALRRNGIPVCWLPLNDGCFDCRPKARDFGQLDPPPGVRLRQISTGLYHACGLAEDGRATCWGAELFKAPSGRFTAIDSGNVQTCGLRDNGSTVCWGPITGYWESREYNRGVLTEISAGAYVCGLREDQAIYCFPQPEGPSVPAEIEKFLKVKTAGDHICGLREKGGLVCWDSSYDEYDHPALDERHFVDFTLGAIQAQAIVCGLLKTRHAICWHKGDGGEDYSPATILPEDQQYSAISASDEHVCAILLDKSLICAPGMPFHPSPAPEEGQYMDVSVGNDFACALNLDGSPVCWGNPGYGRTSPPKGERFTSISSGRTHACGLRQDGTVACWGWNDFGQTKPPE